MSNGEETDHKVCAGCGAFLESDAESCIICGTSVDEPQEMQDADIPSGESEGKECPSCESFLGADDAECFICGYNFDVSEEPTATAEPEVPAAVEPGESVEPAADTPKPAPGPPEPEIPKPEPLAPEPVPGAEDWDMGVVGGEDGEVVEDEAEHASARDDKLAEEASARDDKLAEDAVEGIPEESIEEALDEDEIEDIEPAPVLGPDEFACSSCGKIVTMGTEKCPSCWTDISPMVTCPACAETVPEDSESCPHCFAALAPAGIAAAPSEMEIDESSDPIVEEEEYIEEEYYEEEQIEEIGVECPFCNSIVREDTDICTECGMLLIGAEDGEPPFKRDWTPRKRDESDYQKKIAIILVFVLLVSALLPFLFALPQVERERIRIDGAFGDWDNIRNYTDSAESISPNVNIITYKMINDANNLYFYIEVEGNAFGDVTGDTARIFIDRDQDKSTGYNILGIGADYQIRVFGHGGQVASASSLRFDDTYSANDFNGFEPFSPAVPHSATDAEDNARFEVRVALENMLDQYDNPMLVDTPVTAVYYMANANVNGDYDFSDHPVASRDGLLYVEQSSLVPAGGIVSRSPSADILELNLTAYGDDITVGDVTLQPGFTVQDVPATIAAGQSATLTVTANTALDADGTFVGIELDGSEFDPAAGDVVIRGDGAYAYVGAAPNFIEIDGAFADWDRIGAVYDNNLTEEPDVMAKNLVDLLGDRDNLNIKDHKTANENNYLNLFVNVSGDMMAGMWVPELEERYSGAPASGSTRADEDETPDYTYTEPPVTRTRAMNPDLDLQRPAKEAPTPVNMKTGEDAVLVYLDTDNSTLTGYLIGDIGADKLIRIYGQDGKVTRTELLDFDLTGSSDIWHNWTAVPGYEPEAFSAGSGLEARISLNAFSAAERNTNTSAYIKVIDWQENGDISKLSSFDVFDITRRRGTKGFFPPPAEKVSGKVTTDGYNHSGDSTVIVRDTTNQKRTTYQTYVPTQPIYDNYHVYMAGANGKLVEVYASNGTYYGVNRTTYSNTLPFATADIELANPLPPTAPTALSLTNMGTAIKAIKLNWTHTVDPDNFRIWRTPNAFNQWGNVSEGDYNSRGYYYGPVPVSTIAGDQGGYMDYVPDAYQNRTNYFFVESVVGSDSNYTREFEVLVDLWAPNITHTNLTNWSAALVPVVATFTDGVGIQNGTLHYRKVGLPTWFTTSMSQISGNFTTGNGDWRGYISVDSAGGPGLYEYYMDTFDGTWMSFFGSGGTPIQFTATAPPTDPYPIFGYVKWGDGTVVGAGASVWVNWTNITGVTINDPSDPQNTNAFSQYKSDLLEYDSNTFVWANGTYGGYWGYNTTVPIIPTMGGELVNITLEAPELDVVKTAPATALPGDTIMYIINVTNVGNTTAYNVTVNETYDPWVNFTDSNPPTDNPPVNDTWTLPNLAPGESFIIYINVTINGTTPLGTFVINNATANLTGIIGTIFPGDFDTASTLIGAAVLNITKWATPFANTGQDITYWLNYSNVGTEWATNVVITENYPPGVTFVSSMPPPTIPDNVWIIPLPIAPAGAGNAIEITVNVANNASGTLWNWANISGNDLTTGTVLENDTAYDDTVIIDPLMTIGKSGPPFANTGEVIMYTITYQNTGTDTAYNVWITETYDTGVAFVNSTTDGYVPFPPDIGDNVWQIGDLAPGAGGTIFINVTVTALSGILNNTVTLINEDANGEAQPDIQAWWDTIIGNPIMVINKTANATANTGETIMYVIQYFNSGTDDAFNVNITETYPAGVTFVDSQPILPTFSDNVWIIPIVPAGTGGAIYINVTINPGVAGVIINTVNITFNNTAGITQPAVWATADTLVEDPHMTIEKQGQAVANSGETITYTIWYNNTGPGWAYNINITEIYPPEVTYVSAVPAPTFPNDVWIIPNVAPGGGGSIQITVTINNGTSGQINNTAILNYTDAANQTQQPVQDWFNTTVDDPVMSIEKTAPATGAPLGFLTYTVWVNNTGTETAYNVVVTEYYPTGVTFIVSSILADNPGAGDNIWTVGDLPGGFSWSVVITVQVDAGTTGMLENIANLTYENADAVPQPEIGASAFTNITWPVITVEKVGSTNSTAGGDIWYWIFYNNTGTDWAYNVTITENYPANTTFNNSSPPPDIGDNVWIIGGVAPGTVGIIYINLTIDASATGLLVNNVSLVYDVWATPVTGTVYAEWTTFLSGPYMTVNKTVDFDFANTGQTIMYTIIITNNGDDTAYDVVVTETYPPGVTFVDASPPPDFGNNVWDGSIPDLAPGASFTIFINVTIEDWVLPGTVLTNWVTLDYNNSAGLPLPSETDSASTTVIDPLLTIEKVGPGFANTGETISYIIWVNNTGSDWANNINVTESYDPGVTYVDASPLPDFGNDVWNGSIPDLAPGASFPIYINVTINALSGNILNFVNVSYEDNNTEVQPVESDTWVTQIRNPLVNITKSAPGQAAPGQTITYWIDYSNLGDWAYNVTIIEVYPIGVTFVSSTPIADNPGAGDNIWTFLALAPGASGTIQITVTIDAATASGTVLTNIATADYNNSVGIPQTQEIATADTLVVDSLIIIDKEVPPFANTGQQITYWLNYTNVGTDWAYNIVITENYPAGVTFIDSIPGPPIRVGNNVWLVGDLAPLASGSIQITVQVDAGVAIGTNLLNNVTVDYENAGGMAFQNWDANTTVVIDPIMTIEKTGPATAAPGQEIMYIIYYNNTGNDVAHNVTITENYPPEVSFVNSTPAPSNPGAGDNIWIIGDVPPGNYVIYINVTISPTASGTLTNTVIMDHDNGFISIQDNFTFNGPAIQGPYIVIMKTGPLNAVIGQTITYTITYINTGPDTAYNVWINETYPGFVNFVSSVPLPTIPNWAWDIPDLAPGASGSISIDVTILAGATFLNNTVMVEYSNAGGMPFNDTAYNITYVSGPQLTIEKSAPAYANTGETITYTIWINNTGNQTATNVWVNETYPAGLTYVVGGMPPPINPGAGDNMWFYASILSGGSEMITIFLTVDNNATNTLMNTAWVDYQNSAFVDWPTAWAWANTTIRYPLLTIDKTAPGTANTGEIITYTITVENTGTDIAYDVWVFETYDPGVVFVSSTLPPFDANNDSWSLGDMNPGTSIAISITVQVTALGGILSNFAEALYNNSVRVMPPVSDTANTSVINPNVSMIKMAPATANSGQTITYTIWINNTGDDWAYNLVVTETYPLGATFQSAIPAPDFPTNNVWTLPPLAPNRNTSIQITILVEPWAAGWLNNTVDLDFDNAAGIAQVIPPATNSTLIIDPLMTITKSAPATATHTEVIMYTITYENVGNDWAYNVIITETYPPGVTFVNSTPNATVGNNIWIIPSVAPGATGVIYINVTINSDAIVTQVNNVDLEYEDANGETQTPITAQDLTLIVFPTLIITKTANATANTGQFITYSIEITNLGNSDAENVTVTEIYPAGVVFVISNPVADNPGTGDNIWTILTIAPGATVWINITVQVTALSGPLTDIVNVDYTNYVGYAYPTVSDTAPTQIINPFVEIDKSAPSTTNTGSTITYWINVTNNGDDWAYNLNITETYPAGVTFNSAFPVPTFGNNIWLIAQLAPGGGSASIQITVDVNPGLAIGTVLVNTADVDYENAIGGMFQDSDFATTTVIDPELTITKTGPALGAPGEIIMYTITVNNTGTDWAYNVVITETYPPGTTFVDSNPVADNPGAGDNIWTIGAIGPGAGWVLFINISVDPATSGNITNLAVVDYDNNASVAMQNNTNWTTLVEGPYVTIDKIGPATAVEGGIIMYTIYYENVGNNTAYNVWINDTYPADVTFVDANPVPTVGDNSWFIGNLVPGAGGTIFINVTVNIGATWLINYAYVNYSSDALGNVTFNNLAYNITLVNSPWLTIDKTAPGTANPGETIMYTITVTNVGSDTAYNIIINETYPAGVVFVDSSIVPDVPTDNLWTIASLIPGQSITLFINVTIQTWATGILNNTVSVDYDNGAGIGLPTRMAWADTTLINPDVQIVKAGPAEANPGETITYWLNYTNNGDDWAYDVIITETYPVGVTFVSSIPVADNPGAGDNIWTIPALAPLASGSIQITVTVNAGVSGTIVNFVELIYNNSVGIPQEPVNDTFITDVVNPLMSFTKEAPASANPGEFITYWLNYSNTGDDWAYNVIITEIYPAGVSFISAIPWPDISDNVWLIGMVAPGTGGSIEVTVQINNGTTGMVVNLANINYENRIGTSQPMIEDSAPTTIIYPALEVTKMAPATANTGETFVYRIYVNNTGTNMATNIVVTETYPVGVTYLSAAPMPDVPDTIWLIPVLLPGASWFVDITVTVNLTAFGTLVNVVDVDYQDHLGYDYPSEADSNSTAIIDPDVSIVKVGPATANTGQQFTYWLNYTNSGFDTAYNIVITENYPAGINYVTAFPLPDVGNNVWNSLPPLAPGATGSIQITVQVDLAASGWQNNTVSMTYWSNVRQMPPESAYLLTEIIDPDVVIIKEAPGTVNTGQQITYWLNYTNIGDDWAYNVTITETYPAGINYVTAIPLPDIGNNVWNTLPPLAPGASGSIQITVQVDPNAVGWLDNDVTLAYNNTVRPMTQVSVNALTQIIDPYIVISKSAPALVYEGQIFYYEITVNNMGDDDAYNVWVYETYPPGINFISSVPANVSGSSNIWFFSMIPANSVIVINITVQAAIAIGVPDIVTNRVRANYTDAQGEFQSEALASAITEISGARMTITKDATPYADPLGLITYWINYTNNGPGWAYNIVITEVYPVGVTFMSAIPMPDVPNNIWNPLLPLAPGGSGSIEITVQVNIMVTGVLDNLATLDYENVIGTQYPPIQDNAITVVGDTPFVDVAKSAPAFANSGETIMYTITWENIGNVTAYNVWINETYPFGVSFVNSTPLANVSNNAWYVGNITPGTSGVIFINVTVTGDAYGTITNMVEISYQNSTWAYFGDLVFADTYVRDALMELTKTANLTATAGETIMYTIDYFNSGNDTAYDVWIVETYPVGVTFVDSNPIAINAGAGDNIWYIGNVAPLTGGTIFINVTINIAFSGFLNNTVGLDYNNTVNVPKGPVNASAQTVVDLPAGFMIIDKWATSYANPNGTIMYLINYTNLGAGPANNVWINETYPPNTDFINSSIPPTIPNWAWNIGVVPADSTWTLYINISVNLTANGTLLNMVTIDWDGTGYDAAYANTTIINPDMNINKTAPGSIQSGPAGLMTYTLNYSNTGTDTAYDVTIVETYPPGVIFFSAVPAPTFGNNIWVIPVVLAGGSGSILIQVVVNGVANGTVLVNNVSLDYNNTADVQMPTEYAEAVTVVTNVIMTVEKTGPVIADPGTNIFYFINIVNFGPGNASDVTVIDTYPSGVTYVNSWLSVNGSAYVVRLPDVGTNTWNLGQIFVDGFRTLRIEVAIDMLAPDQITNMARLNWNDTFSNTHYAFNNWTTVLRGPLMQFTKIASAAYVSPGDTLTYTIDIRNIGQGPALNVSVTEYYPAGVTFLNSVPLPSAGNNVWNLGTMNPGDFIQITITVQVDMTAANGLTNWARLLFQNISGGWWEDWDDAVSTVLGGITNLDIRKTGPITATTGELVTYTITYRNVGTGLAKNVYVDDDFDPIADLTYVGAVPPESFTLGNTRRWWIGNLYPGDIFTIDVSFTINALSGTVWNYAWLNYTDMLGIPGSELDNAWTIVQNPLMNITKSAPATANSGQTITYWINYMNNGDSMAHNVTITELYPVGVIFQSSIPVPTIPNNVWFIGDVAPGASGSIQITVLVTAGDGSVLLNIANVSYQNMAYVNQTVEWASASTTVLDPLLTIQKSAPATANSGETIMYIIWVNNTGGATAYNIIVTETYPAGTSYFDSSIPPTSGDNVWNNIPDLIPGGSYAIYVNLTIDVNTASGTTIQNSVTVNYTDESGEFQPEVQDTADTQILDPLLTVTKIVDAAIANTGQTIMYTITITNTGLADAYNIFIIETYSPIVIFVNSSIVPDNPGSGDNIWTIASLAAGASITLFINVTANPSPGTTYTIDNTVTVNYEDEVGEMQEPVSDDATTLVRDPSMRITKTATDETTAGGTIMYTITYDNLGSGDAVNVIITETYPAGITFINSSIVPDNPGTGNDTWTIPLIGALTSGTLFINVSVDTNVSLGAVLINNVTLDYENLYGAAQPQIGDTDSTTIIGPDLTIDKTGPVSVDEGDQFTYNITITNNGDDWAYNITINDTIPAGLQVDNTIPSESYINGSSYYWNITIGPGGTFIIQITVTALAASPDYVINNATLDYENVAGLSLPTLYAEVNTTIVHPLIVEPIMTIVKTAPASVVEGSEFTYTLYYENIGNGSAYNVEITEAYPPGLIINSSNPPADIGNNIWIIGEVVPGQNGTIIITVFIPDGTAPMVLVNNATLSYMNRFGQTLFTYDEVTTAVTTISNNPPTIFPQYPEFVYAGEYIIIRAVVTDQEDYTDVGEVVIYYTDIFGNEYSAQMTPLSLYTDPGGNGIYEINITFQVWKGIVSFFIWANDTWDASAKTGIYDVIVQIPPYFVWGLVFYNEGDTARNPILSLTNLVTSETVIAVGDEDGNYIVDLGTLYSGYMDDEEIKVFGTDGAYYGSVNINVDIYASDDDTMEWSNIEADVMLNLIPEFSTIFVPLMLTLMIFVVLRRREKKRRGDEAENN